LTESINMRAYKFSIKKTIDYIIMSDLDSMQTDTQTIFFSSDPPYNPENLCSENVVPCKYNPTRVYKDI